VRERISNDEQFGTLTAAEYWAGRDEAGPAVEPSRPSIALAVWAAGFVFDEWRDRAACRRMPAEVFFPKAGDNRTIYEPARQVCSGCEVRVECRDYAVASGEPYGMWGGLSPEELRKLRGR
jgi:WhiB family transcriptional regulator, redox-sensing transcriptional regulator